jgi:hypothetical protein
MFEAIRRSWNRFRAAPAGTRFQSRHRRRESRSGLVRKVLVIAAGGVLIALGVVMIVLPGPGLLAMLLGAALIAEESSVAARWFDRADLFADRAIARSRGRQVSR